MQTPRRMVFLMWMMVGCSGEGISHVDPLPSKSPAAGASFGGEPTAVAKSPSGTPKSLASLRLRSDSDPCTSDAQCQGGICLQVAGVSQRYCTQRCEESACSEGSLCYPFSSGGSYCLKQCTASSECHAWQVCDTDATCWVSGQALDSGNTAQAGVSAPCTADSQCAGGVCLEVVDSDQRYCTQRCEPGECPAGSTCYPFATGGYCLQSCATSSDCHPWLICDADATCWSGDSSAEPPAAPVPQPPADPVPELPAGSPVGGACDQASDCADPQAICYQETVGETATGFVNGTCLVNECSAGTCPSGSVCKAIYWGGGTACVASCDTLNDCRSEEGYECVGWSGDRVCWPRCGTAGCPEGYACDPVENFCIAGETPEATAPVVEAGSVSTSACELPEKNCSGPAGWCSELIAFAPKEGPGYTDYPLNGETSNHQYRSYARRDLVHLIRWATAYVDCVAKDWEGGNGHPLGLGDMSEADGAIPGTSDGDPGHPPGTHTDGRDMDIAYYQQTGPDNHLRPVCPHGGQYHCTAAPHNLDVWRTALFVAALLSSERTRVVGVDGQIGPLLEEAMEDLEEQGVLPSKDVGANASLAYETVNNGSGWYYFHHHHLHVSLSGGGSKPGLASGPQCLGSEGCPGPGVNKAVDGCFLETVASHPPHRVPPLR